MKCATQQVFGLFVAADYITIKVLK